MKDDYIIAQQHNSAQGEAQSQQTGMRQLELFPFASQRGKPQISSIPGISPKKRDRYRVMVGDRVLGDRLTLDEALNLAKRGNHA